MRGMRLQRACRPRWGIKHFSPRTSGISLWRGCVGTSMKQELVGSSDAYLLSSCLLKHLGNPLRLRRGGCQSVAFRTKVYKTIEELQQDLGAYLEKYNNERTHQGKHCLGNLLYGVLQKR